MKRIDVCICTFRRPELLRRLLEALLKQQTNDQFRISVVVADNDASRSAEPVVAEVASHTSIPIHYVVEPQQNIALARNKAIAQVTGDLLAFIDDDEIPPENWLLTLFGALEKYGADGVLGPVKPYFEKQPPRWVMDGGFYDRPSYRTGLVIDWKKGRTGNVLLKRAVFANGEMPFRPEFRTGEDQDFFRRKISQGFVFVWCHEALAYEVVPPERWQRGVLLKRALLRGATSLAHPTTGMRDILKSIVAIPAYTLALPFAALSGQSCFMPLLIRLFDHLGRILLLCGLNPVKEPYVTT